MIRRMQTAEQSEKDKMLLSSITAVREGPTLGLSTDLYDCHLCRLIIICREYSNVSD